MWVCHVCCALGLSDVTLFMLHGIQRSSLYNSIKLQYSGQRKNRQYLFWKLKKKKRKWQRILAENKHSRSSVFIFFQFSTVQFLKKLLSVLKNLSWAAVYQYWVTYQASTRVYELQPGSQSKFGEFSATDSAGPHNLALLLECMAVPRNLSVFQCIRLTFISLSTQLICQKNPLQCLERCLQTECPSSAQAVI